MSRIYRSHLNQLEQIGVHFWKLVCSRSRCKYRVQSCADETSGRQCFVESGTRGQINDSINGFIEQGNEGLSIKIELLGLKQSILVQTRI